MKAVITEIRGAKAAALQEDGSVRLLENRNFQIGQVIDVKNNLEKTWYKKATSWIAAAAALLLVATSATSYAYLKPVATVNLDVNPSIEFRVNQFDTVLKVKALNSDGEEILKSLELKGMKIDAALQAALDEMVKEGIIGSAEETPTVLITVNHKNEEAQERLSIHIGEHINAYVKEAAIEAEVEVEGIGAERVALAKSLETYEDGAFAMTPGKLNLIQKLNLAEGNLAENLDEAEEVHTFMTMLADKLDKEVNDLTVQDIMKEIKRARLDQGTLPEEKDKGKAAEEVESTEAPGKGGKPATPPGQGKDKENSNNSNSGNSGNNSNSNGKGGN